MKNVRILKALCLFLAFVLLGAALCACAKAPEKTKGPSDVHTDDPGDTESGYDDYRLPEKIGEMPDEEQLFKDICSGIVYLKLIEYDLSGTGYTDEIYKFTDMPALIASEYAKAEKPLFRGKYKLEAENIVNRGHTTTTPGYYTVTERGIFGLFEKEVFPLKFSAAAGRPDGHYAIWRLTGSGETTSYLIYTDGKVARTTDNKAYELADTKIAPECAAYFYCRSLMLGGTNDGETAVKFSSESAADPTPRFYVQKDGENRLLTAEQSAKLLETLGCTKSGTSYSHAADVKCAVQVDGNKKEAFRFQQVRPSTVSETGYTEPSERAAGWYRVYEDGTVARIQETFTYSWENPFYAGIFATVVIQFSSPAVDVESALAAIAD